jgi:hypothetical protein
MQEVSFEQALAAIRRKDPRYGRDAYIFVREALDYAQKNLTRAGRGRSREEWGVRRCEDFGEIVFNMIDVGWLAKKKTDTRADFEGGYDFDEAFRTPFLPQSRRVARSPKAKPQGSVS